MAVLSFLILKSLIESSSYSGARYYWEAEIRALPVLALTAPADVVLAAHEWR